MQRVVRERQKEFVEPPAQHARAKRLQETGTAAASVLADSSACEGVTERIPAAASVCVARWL